VPQGHVGSRKEVCFAVNSALIRDS